MAIEVALRTLNASLHTLHEALTDLRTTIVEDKPQNDDVVLVDLLCGAADDLLGWLEGALDAIQEAQQAVGHPMDLNRTWQGLIKCQECVNQIQHRFVGDLDSYERVTELTRFGRRRGGEWQAWTHSVKAALDGCQPPLFAVTQALFGCWQEVGERIGINSMLVQATSIGPTSSGPSSPAPASPIS
jgi:hypothetical protein